jgi:D-alanyl-lipoteichoic acid acyltransferase DltB (MBOAT superfamily)
MTGQLIELNKVGFWVACVAGVILLVPWARSAPRKWVFAGLNMGFVAFLLHGYAIGLAGAVLCVYVLLRVIGRGTFKVALAALMGLAVFAGFLIHKLPAPAEQLGLSRVAGVLSVIGFSYVALRMVEVLRAVLEGRHAPPDLPSTINYLLPFHMLAAGPVQSYDDFVQGSALPKLATSRDVLVGMERIATGLFKKFVLASCLQKVFLTDFRAGGAYFLLEIQVFYLWLFLDFSAYSDIAVGVGNLMGVPTPENFNRPLLARNMIDFWERWHMSLSEFIRRNLFIPIQVFLTRKTDARWPLLCACCAIAVSFLLCGAWHGLSLPWVCWGAVQAAGLVVAHTYRAALQRRLGTRGLKRYRANPWIRAVATALTFEFTACSLALIFVV